MLADSVELIPLWQAVGRLGSLGMIAFIYRDHKIQPLDPFPSQLNPLHSLTPSLRSNLIFYAHLRLGLPSVSDFIYFVCATCSAYLILEVIAQIFGEEYKLCSSSLCNFVELPATSSLLVPGISSVPCSHKLSVYSTGVPLADLIWSDMAKQFLNQK